jgi:hypothetical protein
MRAQKQAQSGLLGLALLAQERQQLAPLALGELGFVRALDLGLFRLAYGDYTKKRLNMAPFGLLQFILKYGIIYR